MIPCKMVNVIKVQERQGMIQFICILIDDNHEKNFKLSMISYVHLYFFNLIDPDSASPALPRIYPVQSVNTINRNYKKKGGEVGRLIRTCWDNKVLLVG